MVARAFLKEEDEPYMMVDVVSLCQESQISQLYLYITLWVNTLLKIDDLLFDLVSIK